ncbi:hypothetical protein JVT61DRAFT_5955 [Boletus reticuloceps]|uniref:Uncharacterized protein n=1 Tax=Boletus reticuloceps TaxID=495285 RepID=A0A8I2YKH7_9AGAM|nr:hypothetical protein JVT61DRAFT_5955 [Boletus reticuloceps]
MYTYNLFASDTHVQIFILVESEPDQPNHYTFSLSMKIGQVERALCTPVTMKLSVDPRKLEFVVFVFPPRTSLPTGCLYHLRTWLRTGGVDHCMFAEQELWFGKDPDLRAIADASFARLLNATQDVSIYRCMVGRANVSFILRWTFVEPGTKCSPLDRQGPRTDTNAHFRRPCPPLPLFLLTPLPNDQHDPHLFISPRGKPPPPRLAPYTPVPLLRTLHPHLGLPTSTNVSGNQTTSRSALSLAFESVHQIVLATPGPSGPSGPPGWMSESGSGSGFGFGFGDEADEPPEFDPMATLMRTAMEGMGTVATMTTTTTTTTGLGLGVGFGVGTALTPNRKVSRLAAPNVNVGGDGATADDSGEAVDDR